MNCFANNETDDDDDDDILVPLTKTPGEWQQSCARDVLRTIISGNSFREKCTRCSNFCRVNTFSTSWSKKPSLEKQRSPPQGWVRPIPEPGPRLQHVRRMNSGHKNAVSTGSVFPAEAWNPSAASDSMAPVSPHNQTWGRVFFRVTLLSRCAGFVRRAANILRNMIGCPLFLLPSGRLWLLSLVSCSICLVACVGRYLSPLLPVPSRQLYDLASLPSTKPGVCERFWALMQGTSIGRLEQTPSWRPFQTWKLVWSPAMKVDEHQIRSAWLQ